MAKKKKAIKKESATEKLIKASAVYALASGIAMAVVWALIILTGILKQEISSKPVQYYFLIGAEVITAILLLISAIGLFIKSEKLLKLFYIGMGMLLYAVIFATGKFLNLGFPLIGILFAVVSVATMVLLVMHLTTKAK